MSKSLRFVKARFPSTSDNLTIQSMLITHDPLGFVEEEDWWEVYFDEKRWPMVEASFKRRVDDEGLSVSFELETIDQKNWNQEWEDSIEPIRVSDRFVIAPSWHSVEQVHGVSVLTIDPKMSFGTGYHATTRLMLRLMETTVRPDDRVLDMGTGTGVLAIAAILLGAREADGVDTDEWSYDNALENAQRNRVDAQCHFRLGSIEQASGVYDLILSNITKIDNLQLLPGYLHRLNTEGRLILSGFYLQDATDMRLALENLGMRVMDEAHEQEWCVISAMKDTI
ncbi:MAG: 50S ribosomal protein L11 methyltransferase [Bacteroidetes bacterium]|nr:50S ribosomal protein L11 methyltransferase [Bacteroidota bacterium]